MSQLNTTLRDMLNLIDPVIRLLLLIIICLIGLAFWLNHLTNKTTQQVNQTIVAVPSNKVEGKIKAPVPIKAPVKVYKGGSKLKESLNLPPIVINDPFTHVLASNETIADDHPHRLDTVINEETGEVETFDTKLPLPWVAWDDHGKIGMYGGVANGRPAVKLEAEQGIFQIKAVHFGVNGHITQELNPPDGSTGTDWFIGAGAWYRW